MMPFVSAISARKAISIAPTLIAMPSPSVVPRAIAARKFESCSTCSMCTTPMVFGLLGLRHEHFRNEQRPRRGHDYRCQQVPRLHSERDVGRHDSARNVRHAARHDRHQLGLRQVRQKRPDRQRRFRLPHENARRDVQRLRPARAHHPLHHPCRRANHHLHHAEVIQQRKQRGDENNRRQNLKRKNQTRSRTAASPVLQTRIPTPQTRRRAACSRRCPTGKKASARPSNRTPETRIRSARTIPRSPSSA